MTFIVKTTAQMLAIAVFQGIFEHYINQSLGVYPTDDPYGFGGCNLDKISRSAGLYCFGWQQL